MNNPVLEGKQLILYEDDASRLITRYGLFDNATTHDALDTFRRAVDQFGLPRQLISDHGTQFCVDKENDYLFRETVENMGTEHIGRSQTSADQRQDGEALWRYRTIVATF